MKTWTGSASCNPGAFRGEKLGSLLRLTESMTTHVLPRLSVSGIQGYLPIDGMPWFNWQHFFLS